MSDGLRITYQCTTCMKDDKNEYREECSLCNCAPFGKMVLEPGIKSIEINSDEYTPEDMFCPHTGSKLVVKRIVGLDDSPGVFRIAMNKDQVKVDRKKRSTEHFKKEVLPNLGKTEKDHFKKKGY